MLHGLPSDFPPYPTWISYTTIWISYTYKEVTKESRFGPSSVHMDLLEIEDFRSNSLHTPGASAFTAIDR